MLDDLVTVIKLLLVLLAVMRIDHICTKNETTNPDQLRIEAIHFGCGFKVDWNGMLEFVSLLAGNCVPRRQQSKY